MPCGIEYPGHAQRIQLSCCYRCLHGCRCHCPDTVPFVVKAKEMGIYVIGELELAAQLSRGTLISVTGTNGKTTTVSLLGEIFANSGKVTHVVGNIGYPFSLASLISRKEDVIVCEVSSFQMETADTFHPHVALLTNITEDHLNRHGTMEVYTALKMRIKGHLLTVPYMGREARLSAVSSYKHANRTGEEPHPNDLTESL